MKAELYGALNTILAVNRNSHLKDIQPDDTETVFKVYKAIHKLYPYVKELSHPDQIEKMTLAYGGTITHFLEFLDEIVVSVNNQRPPRVSSIIRLDLSLTAIKEFRKYKEMGTTASAGVQEFEITSKLTTKTLGRSGGDLTRYYRGNSMANTHQAEFIANWANVPNHLADMVNFFIAALSYHDSFGTVVYGDVDTRYVID